MGLRLVWACVSLRVPCANRVLLLMWQELSALSLDLGDHPGGYQYLLFRLRMLMCGGLRGMAAETDAISRSIASTTRSRWAGGLIELG